jgi:hypothetical protein
LISRSFVSGTSFPRSCNTCDTAPTVGLGSGLRAAEVSPPLPTSTRTR